MAIVGVLLLLACANIGGLLLARGAARQQEMAVRVSLGAGRFRMVRQVLTESLLLASMGGVLGLVGARFGATMLMRIMTSGTRSLGPSPRLEIPLDARVLTFTIGVTLLAALVFGLAPAIAAFVSAPAPALRQGGAAQPRSRRVFGNGLVVAQVAISLALLSVSQLYIAHLRHLRDRSLGFDRDGVLLMSVNTSRAQNREQLAGALQGVVAAPAGDSRRALGRGERDDADCPAAQRAASCGSKDSTNPRRTGGGCPSIPCRRTISSPTARRSWRDGTFATPTWNSRAASSSTRRWRGGTSPAAIRLAATSGSRTSAIPTRSSASLATRSIRTLGSPRRPSSTVRPDVERIERPLAADERSSERAVAADARRIVNDVFGADSVDA